MPWSTYGIDGQRKYLTHSETDRFLDVARTEGPSVHNFCLFLATTGCRISEALMMTPRSIDFEAGVAIIESLKKRRKCVYRAIPVPAALLSALSHWIREEGIQDMDRLWPWSRMTGYRRVTEVMRKAGIAGPWATPKGLRHGFGVRAVQSGAPLHLVQRWLGHADMKTTAIYAGAVGPEEREIASRTWLRQDMKRQKERATSRKPHFAESHREFDDIGARYEPDGLFPEAVNQQNISRKPLVRRFALAIKDSPTCQMIRNYLFRSMNYR